MILHIVLIIIHVAIIYLIQYIIYPTLLHIYECVSKSQVPKSNFQLGSDRIAANSV